MLPAVMAPSDVIQPRLLPMANGSVLYDNNLLGRWNPALFDPGPSESDAQLQPSGGRGATRIVNSEAGPCVVRRSRRGGLIARISRDRYVYLGAERTRMFKEWRLLANLWSRDFPVPRPVAARFLRPNPWSYEGGLATQLIEGARTLAAAWEQLELRAWEKVGACIRKFDRAGVYHADLNAHNVLLTEEDDVYLVDFDRGRLRAGAWRSQVMIKRLRRSVEKVTSGHRFPARRWAALLGAYAAETPNA